MNTSRTVALPGIRRPAFAAAGFAVLMPILGITMSASAGLIINELFRGSSQNSDYVEFLVTSDITLAELDGIWFGDSKANTKDIDHQNQFNATQIISSVGSFNSTSDVLRAGTLITVGGSAVATDFTYNPDSSNPSDTDAWNITLGIGQGVDAIGSSSPFSLDQNGDVVWLADSQPTGANDISGFLSAIAYDTNPGTLASQVAGLEQSGNTSFQLVSSGDFDGKLGRNFSLTNTGGAEINFGNSESAGGTLGEANDPANVDFTYDLRAVPEPSVILPCLLALGIGLFLRFRSVFSPATES